MIFTISFIIFSTMTYLISAFIAWDMLFITNIGDWHNLERFVLIFIAGFLALISGVVDVTVAESKTKDKS